MKGVRWHYILILVLSIMLSASILIFFPKLSEPETIPPPGELLIPWDVAGDHAGTVKIVEGPVVDAIFKNWAIGKPTLLYIGKPYPDPDRFSVLIWSDHRGRFAEKFPPDPETHLLNKTVKVRGVIDKSKGYPEIALIDPANIWISE